MLHVGVGFGDVLAVTHLLSLASRLMEEQLQRYQTKTAQSEVAGSLEGQQSAITWLFAKYRTLSDWQAVVATLMRAGCL